MKLHKVIGILAALAFVTPALATTGCSNDGSEQQGTGKLEITGKVASALNGSDVSSITVQVFRTDGGAPFAQTITLNNVGGNWSGVADQIPAGTYEVDGEAMGFGGGQLYTARAVFVQIQPNNTAFVSLNFHTNQPADPFQNSAPFISSISTPSRTVQPGATIQLAVTATDADNDPLVYTWSQDGAPLGGAGTPYTWTAPSTPGSYNLTVSVSDGKGGASLGTITMTVAAAPQTGDLAISAQFFDAPQITSLQIFDAVTNGFNSQPTSGDPLQLMISTVGGTIVCPPTGDAFCTSGNTFAQVQVSGDCVLPVTVPWMPPALAPYAVPLAGVTGGPGQACTLRVTVRDAAGAMAAGTLHFHFAQAL